MGETHGQIGIHDVADANEAGILHGLGKAIAFPGIRRGAAVLGTVFAQHLSADCFIALPPVPAAKPAALVAQEFHFYFLPSGQRAELRKGLVQAEIRYHIAKGFTA